MTVAIIPSWFPTSENEVNGIFIERQARLIAQRHAVVVVFPERTRLKNFFRPEKVPVHHHGYWLYRPVFRWSFLFAFLPEALRASIGFALAVRRCLHVLPDELKPTLLHAHVSWPAGIAAVVVGRAFRLPVALTEHTGPFTALLRSPTTRLLTKHALRSAQCVIAVSPRHADEILRFVKPRRLALIPNAVDERVFFPPATGHPKAVRALFLGELSSDVKGLDLLLRALALVRDDLPASFQLQIAGDGKRRPEYERLARELGVAEFCSFLGALRPEVVPGFLQQGSFLVLPSRSESFGVVVIEAMACGLPVLATRCGGPEYTVEEASGILVEAGNAVALARGMKSILNTLPRFDRDHIVERCLERFGTGEILQQTEAVYDHCLAPS